jgi:GAF domain-containing protein
LDAADFKKISKTAPQDPVNVSNHGIFGKLTVLFATAKITIKQCAVKAEIYLPTAKKASSEIQCLQSNLFFMQNEQMMTGTQSAEISLQKMLCLLQEISNTAVLTENVSTIANLMIDLATTHTLAQKGSIMLLNNSKELYIIASRGLDPELARTYRSTLDQGIVGKVAALMQPVFVEDITVDDRFRDTQSDRYLTRSFISCPIIAKDRLLGIININDRQDGQPFTENDFSLIKILANQAAAAIRNAQLGIQIKAKALELEELNRKLINSDLAKAEFLTRISHELRSPLNSMKGALYCLRQDDSLPPEGRREFQDILDLETRKMVDIVEDQVDHLRLEGERILIKPSIIDLHEMIDGVISSAILQESLSRKKIKVSVHIPEEIPYIAGDKILVNLMFIHLLEGLTSPLKKNAAVELSISEKECVEINFEVSQRFPEMVTSQLFNSQAFFQKDLSNDTLKLILARKTAENHGWTVTAQNTVDSFEIQLLIPKESRRKKDVALTTAMDLYLDFVSEILNLNTCSVMLADQATGDLTIRGAKGIEESIVQTTRIRVGERIAGWVAQEGKPLLIENIETDERFPYRVGNDYYNSKSLLSLPLKIHNRTIGVLNLNNKKSANSFNQRDLTVISMIGDRISRLIETLQQKDHRDAEYKQLATSLENLLNVGRLYQKKNPQTLELVEKISVSMGFDEGLKNDAIYSAMFYDLGLMLVSEGVLHKAQPLTSSEANTIKVHPHTTVDLLSKIEFSERIKKSILHHHENWDGSGYPNGLKGNQIPIISRVLGVVDAYFSLIEPRPYRPKQSHQEALAQIRSEAGTKYDPAVVAVMEECFAQ